MRGEKVLAEANLKQALKYNENNEGALLDLDDFYMADKSWEPALDALRKAAELNPANRDRLVALGGRPAPSATSRTRGRCSRQPPRRRRRTRRS